MPGGFPQQLDLCDITNLIPGGVVVTTPGTANTKGPFVQLTASTPTDACAIMVAPKCFGATNSSSISFDFAIGPSGSEQIIIHDIVIAQPVNMNFNIGAVLIPMNIPAGTRISYRVQTSHTTNASSLDLVAIAQAGFTGVEGYCGVDAIGFNAATTLGTPITSGGAGVKGTYAQLISATARDYVGFMVAFDDQNNASNVSAFPSVQADIAIGPSGSEKIIFPDWPFFYGTGFSLTPGFIGFVPMSIPAGTRIAARCFDNVGTLTHGVTFYGVY